jgi:hypothetical protein
MDTLESNVSLEAKAAAMAKETILNQNNQNKKRDIGFVK